MNNFYKNDVFWINDPSVLFCNGNIIKVIPLPSMTKVQMLNALTRFFLLLLVLVVLFAPNIVYILLCLSAIILIVLFYYMQIDSLKQQINETVIEKLDNKPTVISPQINIDNILSNINTLSEESSETDNNTGSDSNNDINDINDQTAFAEYLYKSPQTCKENPEKCKVYNDLRYNYSDSEKN